MGAAVLLGLAAWLLTDPGATERPGPARPAADATAESVAPAPPDERGAAEESAAAPAAAPAATEFEVLALGPGDEPLPGVALFVKDAMEIRATTDAQGAAVVRAPGPTEALTVYSSGAAPGGTYELRPGRTILRFPELLPLDVETIDAETGEGIAGARVAVWRGLSPPVPLDYHGSRFTLPVSPLRRGQPEAVALVVEPPPGYLTEEPTYFRAAGTISRYAERVSITVLLFREAALTVEVVEADGTPAVGAVVRSIRMGGRNYPLPESVVPASGRIAAPGIPALRGEPVEILATKDGRTAGSGPIRLGNPGEPVVARVVLPPTAPPRRYSREGMQAGASSIIELRMQAPPGSATAEIRVYRRGGEPARECRLFVEGRAAGSSFPVPWRRNGITDGEGVARIPDLPAGEATVTVAEPGFRTPAPVRFVLEDGRTTKVAVAEAAGRAAEILVLDEGGAPLPGARIEVKPGGWLPYCHLVGDRQVLGIATGPDGRVRLDDLPAGDVEITATYGSRRVAGAPGPDGTLTLRLPPE